MYNKDDPFLIFFADTVEPIYHAFDTSNTQLLFDTLGIKRYPITKKSEKTKWKMLYDQLTEVRTQKAIDVLEAIIHSQLIPIPPKVDGTDSIRILRKQCMHRRLQFNSFYSWIMHNLLLLGIFYIQMHNFQQNMA